MRPIEKIKMDLTDVISRSAPGPKLDSKIFETFLLVSKISFHHMIIPFTRYIEFYFNEQCRFPRNIQQNLNIFVRITYDTYVTYQFQWNGFKLNKSIYQKCILDQK